MAAEYIRLGNRSVIHQPTVCVRHDLVSVGHDTRIDAFCKLEGEVNIGDHVHIASFVHVGIGGGTTFIEDGVGLASGCKILSGSALREGESMSATAPAHQQRVERKVTTIRRNATVGTNATVLPGVTIGEGAMLASGSVATKDIPAHEVWAGVPARPLYRVQRLDTTTHGGPVSTLGVLVRIAPEGSQPPAAGLTAEDVDAIAQRVLTRMAELEDAKGPQRELPSPYDATHEVLGADRSKRRRR